MDIDINGVSDVQTWQFEKAQNGYSGHHTTKIPAEQGRAFSVVIRTPQEMIFEGTVSFTVHRKLALGGTLSLKGHLSTDEAFRHD